MRAAEPHDLDSPPGRRRVDHAPAPEVQADVTEPGEEEQVAYLSSWNAPRLRRYELVPDRSRKHPTDANELARQIVDEATGDGPPFDPDDGKDPAAVALGRKGGLKGGKARAARMTPEERSEAARKAAKARWSTRTNT